MATTQAVIQYLGGDSITLEGADADILAQAVTIGGTRLIKENRVFFWDNNYTMLRFVLSLDNVMVIKFVNETLGE